MRFRRLAAAATTATLVVVMGATACSSDSSDEKATATTAPEERRTSAAEVAAGLAKINATTAAIVTAAAVDMKKAESLAGDIEPDWLPIEGTIKENDPDTYIAFEDAFAVIEDAAVNGDDKKAATAAQDIATTSATYLAAYPG